MTRTVDLLAALQDSIRAAQDARGEEIMAQQGAKSIGVVSFRDRFDDEPEDPRISAAEDARDFPDDNGREVW